MYTKPRYVLRTRKRLSRKRSTQRDLRKRKLRYATETKREKERNFHFLNGANRHTASFAGVGRNVNVTRLGLRRARPTHPVLSVVFTSRASRAPTFSIAVFTSRATPHRAARQRLRVLRRYEYDDTKVAGGHGCVISAKVERHSILSLILITVVL